MKTNFRLLLLIITLTLSSCNDWLDIDLINNRTDSKQFETEHGFKEALAGVYSNMSSGTLYGQQLSFGMIDLMARVYDYGQVMNSYKMYRDHEYKNKDAENAIYSIWFSVYENIASINHILEWSDKRAGELDATAMKQIKGEALALRAFHHFDIYRLFAPNYKMDKTVKLLPLQSRFGIKAPEIVTTEAFLQAVISDLLEAIDLLKGDPILTVKPYQLASVKNKDMADQYVARINYFAAKALLARVYNDMGGEFHKDARRLAEEVIASETFSLLNGEKSILVPMEEQDMLFSDEHIFSIRSAGIRDNSKSVHKQVISSDGNLSMTAGFKILIYDNDNEDYRLNWFNQLYVIKYNIDNTDYFFPKIPLIRLSEMYLIAAEGWMEDNPEHAALLMQSYKQSRTKTRIEKQTVNTDLIVRERRKDFLFEGSLFFTYKRLNYDILGNTSEDRVAASKEVFVLPIPRAETENGGRN